VGALALRTGVVLLIGVLALRTGVVVLCTGSGSGSTCNIRYKNLFHA
jgi:hypothetical protein